MVNTFSFNHNSKLLLCGTKDGMIRIFDVVQGGAIMGWRAHDGAIISVNFTSDQTGVTSIGCDGKVIEWSLHKIGGQIEKSHSYEFPYENAGMPHSTVYHGGKHFINTFNNHASLYHIEHKLPIYNVYLGKKESHVTHRITSIDWGLESTLAKKHTFCAGFYDGSVEVVAIEI